MATTIKTKAQIVDALNRLSPAAKDAMLGQLLADLIVNHNALLAKLDSDPGVGDTNFVALLSVGDLGTR